MNRSRQKKLVIFTDLDGTLLDDQDYRWTAARPALLALARAHCPLVIVTSKTRAEVEPILRALGRREPFVVENGGAIYIPTRYFPFIPAGAIPERGGWHKVILGTPRPRLVKKLTFAARRAGVQIRGFSQMTAREVAERTGLPLDDARRALRRQYDEPFVILNETARAWPRLREEIECQGFGTTRGSRFFHITGRSDKSGAVARLAGWLRRAHGPNWRTVVSAIALTTFHCCARWISLFWSRVLAIDMTLKRSPPCRVCGAPEELDQWAGIAPCSASAGAGSAGSHGQRLSDRGLFSPATSRDRGYRRLISCTPSTRARTCSTGVPGRMPWPRLKMWPGRPPA